MKDLIKHMVFPMICAAITIVTIALLVGIWDKNRTLETKVGELESQAIIRCQ